VKTQMFARSEFSTTSSQQIMRGHAVMKTTIFAFCVSKMSYVFVCECVA
jgi:hypothetical protein